MSERKKILHVRNKFEGDLIKIEDLPYDAEVKYLQTIGDAYSEGAMYDRVSKQLFRNLGTGSFQYGNDI